MRAPLKLKTILAAIPAMVIWERWKRRNARRYDKEVTLYKMRRNGMQLLQRLAKRKYPWIEIPEEWANIVQVLGEYRPKLHYLVVKWELPSQEMIKCNMDRVSRGNPENIAYGFCLRDDRENFLYAQADAIGIKTNLQAEIKACNRGNDILQVMQHERSYS